MARGQVIHKTRELREQDLLKSGGPGKAVNSARAGFLPIGLSRVPVRAFRGISVHLRTLGEDPNHPVLSFPLYCAETETFQEHHRRRLLEHKVRFVYIRMADQARFRAQTENALGGVAVDSEFGNAEKAAIVYDTSVELMNELLSDPELVANSPRLEQLSRSITTLVMNTQNAFGHLLAASRHDFYTATHMVNVATMMVPLAFEMGFRDPDTLNRICQAGLLHDIGKTVVPEQVLNKKGSLSEAEWAQIRRHPDAGCEYLTRVGQTDPIIMAVTREHHERLDGGGYPSGLKGDQIDPISCICAVVDSFDAMTAFRPFKTHTLSVVAAMNILRSEAGTKYDPSAVDVWMRLMAQAEAEQWSTRQVGAPTAVTFGASTKAQRRRHPRATFHCSGRAQILEATGDHVAAGQPILITAHSVSRSGMAFLSPTPIDLNDFLRVHLDADGWSDRPLDGQAVRCSRHSDSWYDIGIEFAKFGGDNANALVRAVG